MIDLSFQKGVMVFICSEIFFALSVLLITDNSTVSWMAIQAPPMKNKHNSQFPQTTKVLKNPINKLFNASSRLDNKAMTILKTAYNMEERSDLTLSHMLNNTKRKVSIETIKTRNIFKNEEIKVLIWTTYFSKTLNYDTKHALEVSKCSVKLCSFHHDKSIAGISSSDAVLFHMWGRDFNNGDPIPGIRFPWQNYIFFSVENPMRLYYRKKLNLTKLDGFFNLTATYKQDSDVPLPYGKYIPRTTSKPSLRNYFKENRRDKTDRNATILWVASHCKTENNRMLFVKELQKHIKVDIFGRCGKPCKHGTKCGAQPYMFYLALENGDCEDYITEKVWKNSFRQNLIPVVLGTKVDYRKLLPPNSFIHMDMFASIKDLALHITKISQDEKLYNSYFKWKNLYQSVYTYGFYDPDNICKLCTELLKRRQDTSFNKQYHISTWYGWKEQCAH